MPLKSDSPVVLIAGGIGITPFISFLRTVARRAEQPRIHLAYANRNSEVHAFRDHIDELKIVIPSLTVANIYSAPSLEDRQERRFDRAGRVNINDLRLTEFDTKPLIYQCGPPAMMRAVEAALRDVGHPAERLFQEAFVAMDNDRPIPKGPFSVTFTRSGKTVQWAGKSDGSLLELGEAAGLVLANDLANGCRAGECQKCAQRLVSGSVRYQTDLAFTGDNGCLVCQAMPTSDVVLDA